ncbi:MAG: iron-sulfur cluster assembly scaffold protein [Candidatus Methanofastidiosia archaeon]
MGFQFSKKVIEHFENPRNVGEIKDADIVATVGSPVCGDMLTLYLKIKDDTVEDIKFKTFGCGAAIASSSMFTELVKGKTIDEALKVTNDVVVEALGGLPAPKIHCSLLATDAFKDAVKKYREKDDKK